MRARPRHVFAAVAPATLLASIVLLSAQAPAPVEFDVVSIKRNTGSTPGGGGRTLPDGTQMMSNMPIRNFVLAASPVPTREVVGLPDWATTERYDVTLKPPPGSTPEQRKQMMKAMFADRMKLLAHVEQHEQNVYMIVLARSDGRLGPELKPSTLDCSPRPAGTPPPPPPQGLPTVKEAQARCGMMMKPGALVSGGMRLDGLAASLYGMVGGEVENHTGLDGFYAVNLTFSFSRGPGAPPDATTPADDAPDIFTALQEQLGLKLQREKKMMPVFVIDHIERPSEN